ncbi:porin family protein [Persephonella atlantica]|uniref:Porin family protein n=1 Tax=Persephonella atlantica TaxID=2699429 RepID=A0ABS1GHE7_9AQUI|nr:outer membrane beta-barrel protein [Persephonella atlantica]MBK3332350.1 porin family protein [Persephonella atlantica]
MRYLLSIFIFLTTSVYAVEFSYSAKSFLWKEYGNSGEELLKESGWLHEFGFSEIFDAQIIYIKPYLGVEIGSVSYDGQTQSGIPVKTDTNYWGVLTRLTIGKEFDILFGETGIGYDYWKRNLESSSVSTGYTETWSQLYIPVRAGIKFTIQDTQLYGFGEYRLNMKTKNSPSIVDVTLEPKTGLFFSVGGGVKVKKISVEVEYSYDKWKKSDPKQYGSSLVWQPESKRQTLSFTIGYQF